VPLWERWCERRLRRAARPCDAVLEIQDLGVVGPPYFVYQDLSYDVLLGALDRGEAAGMGHFFPQLDRDAILRRRERQRRVYEGAAGVLAMSRFLADSLVRDSNVAPDRVHVLHPGAIATAPSAAPPPPVRRTRRTRLLFVGTTFIVKGGDLVLEALRHLRRDHDPSITLTVVGPATWPVDEPVPDGVTFRGRLEPDDVNALYAAHDLLVVPSRFEGFGKVFIESLARGVPCIGRDAFAMPELIRPGRNGNLLRSDDARELAALVAAALQDDQLYETTAREAPAVASHFTWDRAADDVWRLVGSLA
jgi:glycosyltransferase involved in cell wall biosynthesis